MSNDSRTDRFMGRAALRMISNVTRCQECGKRSILPGGNVQIRKTEEGVVGFAGLFTCGNVWLCPVCNSKVMARRAVEIGLVLAWAHAEGLVVIWGALTCRHTKASQLGTLLEIQRGAWARMIRSKIWVSENATARVPHAVHGDSCPWECNFKADHDCGPDSGCEFFCGRVYDTVQKVDDEGELVRGRVGYIRAAELTIGDNGYHPHIHPLILFRGTEEEAAWHAADIVEEWVLAVEAEGGEAVRQGGQQLKIVTGVEVFEALNGYVTKSTYNYGSLAIESVWSQGKTGRGRYKGTVSHWTLLGAIEQGLSDEIDLWRDIESAITGTRMITWSRGLRDFAGIGAEKEDVEVAGEEIGSQFDTVGVITARGWLSVWDNPLLMGLILATLDAHGWEGLAALLDFYGVEYATVADLGDIGDDANGGFAAGERDRERSFSAAEWDERVWAE